MFFWEGVVGIALGLSEEGVDVLRVGFVYLRGGRVCLQGPDAALGDLTAVFMSHNKLL